MIKSYLYSLLVGLLLISSVFAAGCNIESGECGEQATSPKLYRAVKETYVSGPGCAATIDITMIPGSGRFIEVEGVSRPAADYQVSVRNIASCVIYTGDVQITPPSGGFVLSTNNLSPNGTEGSYNLVVSQFGGNTLPPGSIYDNATVTAYFLSSGVAPSLDSTIVAKCQADCIAQISTSAGCQARTSVTLRGSATLNSATGKYTAEYDVLIINIGSCGIYEVGLDFSLPPGTTITQTTGLVQTYGVGQYKATGFRNNRLRLLQGDTLASEDSYTASLTAEYDSSDAVLARFTVDSTSFCGRSCDDPLATPAPTSTQCAAIVTAVWIPGSPRAAEIQGVTRIVADYQIQVANFGECSVSSVTFTFGPYSGSTLTNATNLQATGQTNEYTITQPLATPGAVYRGATITGVYAATGFAYQLPLSVVTPQCDGCTRGTDSPVPTSAPTPTSTSAPTPVQGCSATATTVLRTTWKSGSTENRLYDFVITNTGSSVAQSVDLSLGFSTASEVTQSWNVQKISSSVYRANLFAAAPNAVVRSSGYVLTIEDAVFTSGSFTEPTVTVSSTQC